MSWPYQDSLLEACGSDGMAVQGNGCFVSDENPEISKCGGSGPEFDDCPDLILPRLGL